ncbi:MAG: DUF4091 domain-containing protein [Verrucomicrobia bacterium]|nr:DUF4091 domain-containing protein [Verrucomicrobiota bacterium]
MSLRAFRLGGLMWLGMLAAGAAPLAPFAASHYPFDASPPLLTAPAYADVLRGAVITASGHDDEQRAEFVHDGITDDTVMFWTSKVFPAWVKLELPEAREIAQVNLHLRAPGTRVYHFIIEASEDGANWTVLHDQRTGSAPTPAKLEVVLPAPLRVRALRLTVTGSSKEEGPYVCEIAAYARPTTRALEGAVGATDRLYNAGNVPLAGGTAAWRSTAWRGERVSGQFVVWTQPGHTGLRTELSAMTDGRGHELPAGAVTARFVRQVLADGKPVGDVLDPAPRVDMKAGSFRAIWLTAEPPRDAVPGRYTGTLAVRADGTEPKVFPLTLEILPATLPEPKDWAFHLDIWQHPWSIARVHGVTPWSEAHFQIMRPYLLELAHAGQKVITTTITPRPWGSRDYDDYGTMVAHLKQPDGTWKFDYAMFDRYVEFAMSCGIDRQINCISMLTWSGQLEYTDAATGDTRAAMCEPGTPEYADYWVPFLRDFEKHLEAKGWLSRARICVDEAPGPMMKAMSEVLRAGAPRIKIALAGNQAPSHYTGLDLADFTIILDHASDDLLRDIARRRSEGRVTTFYVCLDPKRPNTFVQSPPAEAVWIGYYSAANGYDGFARWAFTTWPENVLHETLYSCHPWRRDLPPGDEFLVYPGPRSSVHWEMLRDGVEEWEKLAWLRAHHGGQLPDAVAAALENFRDPKQLGDDDNVRRNVAAMRAAIETAARATP